MTSRPLPAVRIRPRGLLAGFRDAWRATGPDQARLLDEVLKMLLSGHAVECIRQLRKMHLHHGLLPSFPGLRPYHDAYAGRMLTYGATCHFIVPELDAGNQIIQQLFSRFPVVV